MPDSSILLTPTAMTRALARMAHEIAERNEDGHRVVILGIPRGGLILASRLGTILTGIWQHSTVVGALDVSMHRDDLGSGIVPVVHQTEIPEDINGKTVVLVDDVLYSGRTTRAALDALHDFGRPRRIQLAVLVDRGHRELPIKADFVGKNVPTSRQQLVEVRFKEDQGEDVVLVRNQPQSTHP